MQDIDAQTASSVLARFERHLQSKYVCQIVTDVVLDTACALIDRHALRAYDSVQLAGCLALRQSSAFSSPTFVCADKDLLQAAASEGLQILDPAP